MKKTLEQLVGDRKFPLRVTIPGWSIGSYFEIHELDDGYYIGVEEDGERFRASYDDENDWRFYHTQVRK